MGNVKQWEPRSAGYSRPRVQSDSKRTSIGDEFLDYHAQFRSIGAARSKREQELVDWKEFISQLDDKIDRRNSTNCAISSRPGSPATIFLARPKTAAARVEPCRPDHSETPLPSSVSRTDPPQSAQSPSYKSHEPMLVKKACSSQQQSGNLKSLTVSIPAIFDSAKNDRKLHLPLPATSPSQQSKLLTELPSRLNLKRSTKFYNPQLRSEQALLGQSRTSEAFICQGDKQATPRSGRNYNSTKRQSPATTVNKFTKVPDSPITLAESIATPRTVPIVVNLHLPRVATEDDTSKRLTEEKLEKFQKMLKNFVAEQKTLEVNVYQAIVERQNKTLQSSSSLKTDPVVVSDSPVTEFSKEKQEPCTSSRDLGRTRSQRRVNKPLPPKADSGMDADGQDRPSTTANTSHKSQISIQESFQMMKATISKISSQESYSRGFDAARNFATNSDIQMSKTRRQRATQTQSFSGVDSSRVNLDSGPDGGKSRAYRSNSNGVLESPQYTRADSDQTALTTSSGSTHTSHRLTRKHTTRQACSNAHARTESLGSKTYRVATLLRQKFG